MLLEAVLKKWGPLVLQKVGKIGILTFQQDLKCTLLLHVYESQFINFEIKSPPLLCKPDNDISSIKRDSKSIQEQLGREPTDPML